MDIRSRLSAGALLLASLPAFAGLKPTDIEKPALVTRVDCTIVIDKTGRVGEYRPRTELPELLAQRVGEMVRQVRFEPVEDNGQIVNAQVDMRVTVAATKLPDGAMQLALDHLAFPNADAATAAAFKGTVTKKVPPIYPREALRFQANADTLAAVHVGPDGTIDDAAIVQSALVHAQARPADAARVLDMFERATLFALRQWKVDVSSMSEESRAHGGFIAYIPVQWRIDDPRRAADGNAKPGEWTLETRSRRRVPTWMTFMGNAPQPGVADLANGEMGGVNNRYRLAQPLGASGS